MPNTEPGTWAATIAGAISAVMVALVTLGIIDLTPEQQAALLGAVVAVLPIAGALFARTKTTALADPKVKLESGRVVALVREDTKLPTPQAMERMEGGKD